MSLDFELDAGQRAIADVVTRFCREAGAAAIARREGEPLPRTFWRGLAELGVFALGAPGEEGGAGEIAAAFEALGAEGCPGPLVATLFAVQVLPEPARAEVAAGRSLAAVGEPPLFPFGPEADVFVALDGDTAWCGTPRGRAEPVASLGGEPFFRVALERGEPVCGVDRARRLADVARAAWLSGGALRLVELAAEHARTRRQFGRAIGEFQAVAHPLADAWIAATAAQALARDAACAEDGGVPDAAARCGAARLAAERAAQRSLRVAHQTFGAQGITLEGPLFHLSRRLRQQIALPPGPEAAEAALVAELLS